MVCFDVLSYFILFVTELVNKLHSFIRSKLLKKISIFLFFLSLFLFLSLIFTFFFQNSVKAEDKEILHKYYTVITIEEGDTLWHYAEEYAGTGYDSKNEYMKEVRHINNMMYSDQLISGNKIVLPYYSNEIL